MGRFWNLRLTGHRPVATGDQARSMKTISPC